MDYAASRSALASQPGWNKSDEAALLEPFTYTISYPGKDIRGKFLEAFNAWLNVPAEKIKMIANIVNTLHTASLMIDDIEDSSHLRRGHPVAHKIYGVPQTINSANYVYFLVYQQLFALRDDGLSDIDKIVNEELLALHRGQGKDIMWRDTFQCPTEEEYISMVKQKSGGLLRIGIKLMTAYATTNKAVDYTPLINLMSVYFQIRDDYMNLASNEYTSTKGFADDISEGKFSFPVIHGIHADKSNRQVLSVLQKRPSTPTLKELTIEYLQNHTRSFEYTLAVLGVMETHVREEIAKFGGNKGLEALMDRYTMMAAKIQDR